MNTAEFNKLKKANGTKVVWKDERGYNFSMGEDLMYIDEDEEFDNYDRIQKECGEKNIDFAVGYSDDTVNCITVKELSDIDKVEGLQSFIEEYVGCNCYTD